MNAIEADEEGHAEDDLFGHVGIFLEGSTDEEVEELIGAAELDVCLDHDGVVALDEWVEEFDDGDRGARFVAFIEVITFEHTSDGHFAGEIEGVAEGHFIEPFAVVADFCFCFIEDFENLVEVGLGIYFNIVCGEDGAC